MTATTTPARRALDYWLIAHRHWWRLALVTGLLTPALFLAAMGLGLGGLVDSGSGARHLGGQSYLQFLTPGLLAATAMQTAMSESTWPIGNAMRWNRSYIAMAATPLRPADMMLGQLLFVVVRVGMGSVLFFVVAALFGAWSSPWALACVPAAILCGLAHAAPASAFSVGRTHDHAYVALYRFFVMPMFLFSGTFFPVSQLPIAIRPLAWCTPLWHGVALCRDLAAGHSGVADYGHLAVLTGWLVVGAWWAVREHDRALAR
jgi:lipooligosaccharide transport system permease protein